MLVCVVPVSLREFRDMTESQTPQPAAEPSKRPYKELYGMVLGILVLPALVIAVRRVGIWPWTLLGFTTFGIPGLLIGLRSWNRWFHPDRPPVRWVQDYPRGDRLQTLDVTLTLTWVAGWFARLVIDHSRHHSVYITLSFIAGGAVSWHAFLTSYIADHKYVPAGRPYNPSNTWAKIYKPLQSEHWGQREIANSDPKAIP